MTKEERSIIYTYGAEELYATIEVGALALQGDPILENTILDLLMQAADIKLIVEKRADENDVCALQFLLENQRRIHATCFFEIAGHQGSDSEIAAISFPLLPEKPRIFLKKTQFSTRESNLSDYFLEITKHHNLLVCPGYLEKILIDEFAKRSVVLAISPKLEKVIIVIHDRYDILDLSYQSVPLQIDIQGLKALISYRAENRRTVLVNSDGEHLMDLDVSDTILVNDGASFTIMDVLRRLYANPKGGG